MIVVVVTFGLTLTMVLGAYWAFVLRLETSDDVALRKRLRPVETKATAKKAGILKASRQLSNVATLNNVLGNIGRLSGPLQRDITQAGLTLTVGTLVLTSGCL